MAVYGSNGRVGSHDSANTWGPVLVIGRKGSFGKLQFSEDPVFAIDTTFYVDRRLTDAHLPWLYYALSTLGLDTLSEDVGVPGLSREKAYQLRVQVPPLAEQRAIADYLDTETARIDALVAKKRQLAARSLERFASWRESVLLEAANGRWVRLHHLTDPYRPIVYGIVQAGPEVPDGVPYIKTGDMADLQPERLSRTSVEIDEAYRRARVVPGDIVIAMRASIGLPVMVPPDLPRANLTQGTARIAAGRGIDASWLYQAIQMRAVQEQCRDRAVGTTFKTLNIWDLRRVEIPTPAAEEQQVIAVRRVQSEENRILKLRNRLNQQIDLLIEHRQALITAAVRGQLEVPGLAA